MPRDFTCVSDPMLIMSTLGTAYLRARLQNTFGHTPHGEERAAVLRDAVENDAATGLNDDLM
jgi:hypothetical protein